MKLLSVLILIFLTTGCASQQYRENVARTQAANNELRSQLNMAMTNGSTVNCPTKPSCDKAFSLAKVYVQQNSEMKIQMSDDTLISTYTSGEYGYISLQATKTLGTGDTATIELGSSCKDAPDYMQSVCMHRLIPIHAGFKPFIESRLP